MKIVKTTGSLSYSFLLFITMIWVVSQFVWELLLYLGVLRKFMNGWSLNLNSLMCVANEENKLNGMMKYRK